MRIDDWIYGSFAVDEPLLLDLIHSGPVKRLQGIYMGGITALLGISPRTTRFEHSLGAMLLVRKLNGSLEEQAAALLHDVSHTALSHVIDYALDSPSRQAFHDDEKESYLERTEIPALCANRHVDWRRLARDEHWGLLEQPSPKLCADRIDYTFRDIEPLRILDEGTVRNLADDLVTQRGRIAFRDAVRARVFADAYIACNDMCWSTPRGAGMYKLAADAIRVALAAGTIDRHDLWLTDNAFWDKLSSSPDPDVQEALELVSVDTKISIEPDQPDFVVSPKFRWIDPEVVADSGEIRPLSSLDSEWHERLEDYRQRRAGCMPIKIKAASRLRNDEQDRG